MLTITIDGPLADRLYHTARALGHRADEAALIAIRVWVEDCEESARQRAQLGGGDGGVARDADFMD